MKCYKIINIINKVTNNFFSTIHHNYIIKFSINFANFRFCPSVALDPSFALFISSFSVSATTIPVAVCNVFAFCCQAHVWAIPKSRVKIVTKP